MKANEVLLPMSPVQNHVLLKSLDTMIKGRLKQKQHLIWFYKVNVLVVVFNAISCKGCSLGLT